MSSSSPEIAVDRPRKVFTLEQANATLPLVRVIVKDLVELSREVVDRRERLAHLTAGRPAGADDMYREELSQIEKDLEKDTARLHEYVNELIDLGVEPKNGLEGLVDFPALMDGRLVYLCWKYNEPEVLFWHELEAGFPGRQSLTATSGVGTTETDGGDLGHGHGLA